MAATMQMKSLRASTVRSTGVSRRSAVRVQATARVDKCKKTDIIVSPSILSADFAKLGDEVGAGLQGWDGAPSWRCLAEAEPRSVLPFPFSQVRAVDQAGN